MNENKIENTRDKITWFGVLFKVFLGSPILHRVTNKVVFFDSFVNIYGHFAVRDLWESLRVYLFKISEDDPVMIAPVTDAFYRLLLQLLKIFFSQQA